MTSKSTKGKLGCESELRACVWLMENDYEVFRNVAPVGPVDLVVMRGGETALLDVKTVGVVQTGQTERYDAGKLTAAQLAMGVRRLCAWPDGEFTTDDGTKSIPRR